MCLGCTTKRLNLLTNGMKYFLPVILLLFTGFTYSHRYVLIDKTMSQPIAYTNNITLHHSYKKLFAVEKDKLPQFIAEVEKVMAMLKDKSKSKPQTMDFNVGKTRFVGLKVPTKTEERLDIVLTSNFDGTKLYMHLSDSKISNANNVFFISTWLKYIKTYAK